MMALSHGARRASRRCASLSRITPAAPRGLSALPLPPSGRRDDRDDDENIRFRPPMLRHDVAVRGYRATPSRERSGPAVVLALGAVAATAKAGQYAVQGYNEWREARDLAAAEEAKRPREEEGDADADAEAGAKDGSAAGGGGADAGAGGASSSSAGTEGKRENIFASWFDMSVGSKYYEGGFEDVMTRKEAALILGVRESSAAKRIKEAHRKLLILNHPDTGGSTFLSGKINEAKELLLKGKKV